jgi:hypothetical protein
MKNYAESDKRKKKAKTPPERAKSGKMTKDTRIFKNDLLSVDNTSGMGMSRRII